MENLTELIAGTKSVIANGKSKVIVTTQSGAKVWVPEKDFKSDAETITFTPYKKGQVIIAQYKTDKHEKGDKITLNDDNNAFVTMGKQIVKKYDTLSIMDHLISKNITPTFSLAS